MYLRLIPLSLLTLRLLASGCKTSRYQPSSTSFQYAGIDTTLSAEPAIVNLVAPYKKELDSKMNRVIGQASKDLTSNRGAESDLGNFVADLQRIKASQYLGIPVDMGLVTAGGLRAPILKGEVTVGDIFELMPFENELWILVLKGESVEKMFQYAAAKGGGVSVGGTQAIFEGKNVVSVLIGGKPLDKSRTYTLATSDYLATGGDNMSFLSEAIEVKKPNKKLRDAIISYIEDLTKQGKSAEATVEGRIFIR
jgi:2',3'-cyclic-nucleotide 2'-phosphodiesterase (5'-nucleotidase family)